MKWWFPIVSATLRGMYLIYSSGFDNYHKIVVCYHVRVPQFWQMCRNGQILKSINQASYLSPSELADNFSEARSYLNRMKDC